MRILCTCHFVITHLHVAKYLFIVAISLLVPGPMHRHFLMQPSYVYRVS